MYEYAKVVKIRKNADLSSIQQRVDKQNITGMFCLKIFVHVFTRDSEVFKILQQIKTLSFEGIYKLGIWRDLRK